MSPYPPTERQRKLVSLWCVEDAACSLVMCNLHRAEAIVKRHLRKVYPCAADLAAAVSTTQLTPSQRDAWNLVYHPGEVCHTLTSTNSRCIWIYSSAGRSGLATLSELAAFMGHHRRRLPAVMCRLGVPYRAAAGYLAESVHARMARHCAATALAHVELRAEWLIGSLYSGACDALTNPIVLSDV